MYIEHGHFSLGLGIATVTIYLTYDMTWKYLKSLQPGESKFESTIHIYSNRFPNISYVALIKLFGGIAALLFYLVINPFVGFTIAEWPYYEDGEYKNCCKDLDHLNYSLTIFLSGGADLLIGCVKIAWPKGIDKFVMGVLMFVIGSMLIEHSFFKGSPQEVAIHDILAMLLITGASFLWLEIYADSSFILSFARCIVLFTLGTWLMQTGVTDKAGLSGESEAVRKTYAESPSNQAFAESTFICHILGNVTLMFLFYMGLALRWRRVLPPPPALRTAPTAPDTPAALTNGHLPAAGDTVAYALLKTDDDNIYTALETHSL